MCVYACVSVMREGYMYNTLVCVQVCMCMIMYMHARSCMHVHMSVCTISACEIHVGTSTLYVKITIKVFVGPNYC